MPHTFCYKILPNKQRVGAARGGSVGAWARGQIAPAEAGRHMVPRLRTLRCMRRQLRRGRLAAADGQAGARACELPQIVCRSFWHRLAIGLYVFSISLYRPTPALASLAGRQRGRRDTDSADSAPTEYGGACSRSAAACHRGREGGWSQGARGRLVSIGCARAAGHRGREGGWSASGARGRLVSIGGARAAGHRAVEKTR